MARHFCEEATERARVAGRAVPSDAQSRRFRRVALGTKFLPAFAGPDAVLFAVVVCGRRHEHLDDNAIADALNDRPPTATMRVELFAKDATSLRSAAARLVAFGASGLNAPQKSKAESPLAALTTLRDALPASSFRECVPHYSLKFCSGGAGKAGAGKTLELFEGFCTAAHEMRVRQILLVSGSGTRSFDSPRLLALDEAG